MEAVVNKYGYDPVKISEAINRAIDNGLILGVNYVEPKDINVKPSARAVGVYYTPLQIIGVDHHGIYPYLQEF